MAPGTIVLGQARRLTLLGTLTALLVLLTVGLAAFGFLRVAPALAQIPGQPDFAAYYLAASEMNANQTLYDPSVMAATAMRHGVGNYTPYIYPPLLAALLRPLAYLPFDVARTLWLGVNVVSLFASIGLLARTTGLSVTRVAVPAGFCALMVPAVYQTLIFGQVNLLLLLLVSGSVYVLAGPRRRHLEVLAGVLLGVAAAIKLYPVALALCFLPGRRLAGLASAILTLVAATGLGIFAGGGWDTTQRYFRQVLPEIGSSRLPDNQSLHAVLARFFSVNEFRFSLLTADNYVAVTVRPLIEAPQVGVVLSYGLSALIVALTALALVLGSRRGFSPLRNVAILITAVLLVTPVVWDHYLVLLFVPLFALVEEYRRSGGRAIRLLAILAILLLVLQRYWRSLAPILPSPWLLAFGFSATLLLWSALLSLEVRSREGPDPRTA